MSQAPTFMTSGLRRLAIAMICAKVFLIPVVFDREADAPFSAIKAMASHGLAYVLAGLMLALAIQYRGAIVRRSWLHIPVVAFLLINVASSAFAIDPTLALFGAHDRRTGLGTIADGVLLYFAVAFLVRNRKDGVAVAASALGALAVVLTYELMQLARADPFVWAVDRRVVDSSVRPFSTIGQATSLALYLTVTGLGAAALALFDGRSALRLRTGLFAGGLCAVAGAVLTETRSALVGIELGALALLLLTWWVFRTWRARALSLAGWAVTTAGLAAVIFATPLGVRALSTVELEGSSQGATVVRVEGAADVRLALYRISWEMVRDRPLLGYGPDNFLPALPRYRSDNEPFDVQENPNTSAHSWVAQVAVSSGLVGLAAFVTICVLAAAMVFRARFHPAAWTGLAMLAAFLGTGATTINAVSTDWLFWLSVGVIAAATWEPPAQPATAEPEGAAPRRSPRANSSPSGRSSQFTGLACIAVAVLLAASTWTAIDASRAAKASQLARLQGRNTVAIEQALRSTRGDPRRAQYWNTLGLAYISADRYRDAIGAFEVASNIAPYDIRYDGDLARALAVSFQNGDTTSKERARAVADRAVRTDPNNPLAHLTRATVMQVLNDLPEALKSVERALALDRLNNRDMYLIGSQVLNSSRRPADAITLAQRGIAAVAEPRATVLLRVELARALASSGQLAQALSEIDAALAIQPEHPAAKELRVQIAAALGR